MVAQITGQTVNRPETTICTGHSINERLQDVGDCTRFFQCNEGQLVTTSCSQGWYFNPKTSNCEFAATEHCFQCPTDKYFIDLPFDGNCIQFVRCFAGRAVQHTCTHGLLFNGELQTCNFEHRVNCPCPLTDIPTNPLFIRDRESCSK